MKKIILFLLFFLPLYSFHEFFIDIENNGIFFQIDIRSFQNDQNKNYIDIISVEVQKPSRFDDGKIILEVSNNPFHIQLFSGSKINFKRGYNLPVGTYSLIINDVDYGFLYILEDEVFFDPLNCL